MNAARLEAHQAHKLRRAKMHVSAARLPPKPAGVLPMVRTPPEALQKAVEVTINEGRERKRRRAKLVGRALRLTEVVAGHYGITVDDVCGDGRERRYAWPRQLAMHFVHNILGYSTVRAADAIGRRHHTTLLHGLRAVEKRVASDPVYAAEVAVLEAAVRRALEEKR